MKKKIMILLLGILLIPKNIYAASLCSYSEQTELNTIAGNVRATYEPVDIVVGTGIESPVVYGEDAVFPEENIIDVYGKGMKINILNITEDVYAKIKNDKNENILTFTTKDAEDGIISFTTGEATEVVQYTIEVYANKYDCAGELLRQFTLTTPLFNSYSEMLICDDHKDFYYCQEYLFSDNIELDDFEEKVTNHTSNISNEINEETKEKGILEKIKEFYEKNNLIINSISSLVIIIGIIGVVILIKKKRGKRV